MFSVRAAMMAARRREFMAGCGLSSLAATADSRASLLNSLDFTASCRPLRCMMFLNCECPAISLFLVAVMTPHAPACRGRRVFKLCYFKDVVAGISPVMAMWITRRYRGPWRRFQTADGGTSRQLEACRPGG